MMNQVFAISDAVRYVAIYRDGQLRTESKSDTQGASSSETDRYEELFVNPILVKAASQRGNIDCGGLDYLLIRYGNFFQFVMPAAWGHVSVCIDSRANPLSIGMRVAGLFQE